MLIVCTVLRGWTGRLQTDGCLVAGAVCLGINVSIEQQTALWEGCTPRLRYIC
jgi:hypothetical protein